MKKTSGKSGDLPISFWFDGQEIRAAEGESVAVSLRRNNILTLGRSPVDDAARGVFCMMGVCQECVVRIDGKTANACRQIVRQGMRVETGLNEQ
ncbi:(2Fe-2S)-binding protein [Komagataeibacter xylinus]|uniref:(2Fe-2S)-binding protein n=1 Tax=Komagataeibacter xylinus TaxID=28448 RepID=UPI0019814A3E|nr:(2Fe-2S)-binding protein [Komagataeibacter xylinus]